MGHTAVVTGASRGIGKAICYRLAEDGYDLVICSKKNGDLLGEVSRDIEHSYGRKVIAMQGDVSDEAFVSSLYERAMREFESIDVLVNNAGISYIGVLWDMSVAEWDEIMGVNLRSCFLMSKYFGKEMVNKKRGHIISISSIWGEKGASCEVAYSASKAGVDGFTKALAKELAPSHVAVNAISCGMINTDMNAHFSEAERKDIKDEIPWGEIAEPKDVAECVSALLRMPYVTGQIIGADGGWR